MEILEKIKMIKELLKEKFKNLKRVHRGITFYSYIKHFTVTFHSYILQFKL